MRNREYFEKKIAEGKMLEYAEYAHNYYGTPREPVEEMLRAGKSVILKIEVQGAEKIRKIFPDVTSIFLLPPSMRVLEERLRGRGSEDEETLHHRLVIARDDTVESAVKGIETVIEAENKKTARNKNLISEVIDNV